MNLKEHLINRTPFECDDLGELKKVLTEIYDPSWGVSLDYINVGIEYLRPYFNTNACGSWNYPLMIVKERTSGEAYKVFRKSPEGPVYYEFHGALIIQGEWLKAEISGSPSVSGLDAVSGGKFHMLCDKTQADAYIDRRKECILWKNGFIPDIRKVKARNLLTIDLVFVPPKSFMWGIDAREIYVE